LTYKTYIDLNHDKIIKTKMIKIIVIKRYLIIFDFFVLDFNKLINTILPGSLYAYPKRNL
jgi:hypothetical protein